MSRKLPVRKARGNGKYVSFVVRRYKDRSTKSFKEYPNTFFRQMIAKNLEKIEEKFGRMSRTPEGHIQKALGRGSYGVVFNLENQNVLKITTDPTEVGNALFWKNAVAKNKNLLRAVVKVFNLAKTTFKGKHIGIIEREFVKTPGQIPLSVEAGLEQFVDNFLGYCASEEQQARKEFLESAREGLSLFEYDAPYLKKALEYSWNRGLPQIDVNSFNVGVRVHKVEDWVQSGNIVILDFGLHVSDCWKILNQKYSGKKLKPKDYVAKYNKKVPRL